MAVNRREPVEIAPSRLNPTDATLWDIERNPNLRTTIVAALVLDRPVDRARLVTELEAASRRIPRLRQRVVERRGGIGAPRWEIDTEFDLDAHVAFVDVGGGADDAAIAAVAEPMASSPLDRSRPLWECTYLGGPSGRSAIVLKVHHSLTDGVGGVGLLDVMLDRRRDAPPSDLDSVPIPRPGRHRRSTDDDVNRGLPRTVGLPFDAANAAVTAAFHPRRTVTGLRDGVRSAARLLAPSSAPLSPLLLGRSLDRHIGMTDVDLERLHRAAARHGCTINHAFFAGVVGGIAEYHRELGAPVERLRVTMPVSFRRAGHTDGGNQWAPVRFVVPTDIDDPIDRMHAMAGLVRTSRRERALSFSQTLAGLVQVLPPALSSGVVAGMLHGIDVTLTNVPGLTDPHYLAGAAVERVYAFAPTGGAALNVGFVSHVGTACIGTLSDAAAVSDPMLLQQQIDRAMDELLAAAEARGPSSPPSPRPAPAIPPAAATGPERLSALDTGFLRLETRETPMHIGAAFLLDGGPLRDAAGAIRIEELRRHVEARIRTVPRFTRRIAEVPFGVGRPLWVDDVDFDIRRHVHVTTAPEPGDRQALLDRTVELLRDPLDRARPLWELWFVDGLADGRVGIVEKIHHALVDGVGGVELAAALFDPEPTDSPDVAVRTPPGAGPSASKRLVDAVAWQLADPVAVAVRTMASLVRSPGRLVEQVGHAVAAGGEIVRPGNRAPEAAFNRPIGRRRVLRAVTVDLAEVRRARASHGATVNDVVLTAVAGAARDWFLAGEQLPVDVHALVPVSTRRDSIHVEPGNHVGGVMVELPVGEPDPLERLAIVQHRMQRLKAAHEGEGTATLLDALDHVPAIGYGAVLRLLTTLRFVNLVVTNVPGSPVPLHLLGARIDLIVPVVPLGLDLALGIAVLSYAGGLTISISADPDVCPDVDVFAAALTDQLAVLTAAVAVA